MAQKKRSKKNTKTKAKKKKLSVFTVVLLLIVIVVVGALGYLSIQKLNPLATELAKIQANPSNYIRTNMSEQSDNDSTLTI